MARSARRSRSPWCFQDAALDAALVSGEFAPELEQLFGRDEYQELRQLAAEAQRRGRRGGDRVLILPGIMGSKLGESRRVLGLFPTDDVYWLDPVDVMTGALKKLALDTGSKKIRSLGVFLIAYAKLRLRLRADGHDAEFFPFDWRRSIQQLGRELAAAIADGGGKVSLVAHSMGGLVARAAIAHGAKVERLIQLGSPNFGSYAPLLALRGIDPAVQKIAALDFTHDRTELINRVFRGFPGLIELLPSLPNDPGAVFFDPAHWPKDAAKPLAERMLPPERALLAASSRIQDHLAPVAASWTLIAGVNQRTVTGVTYDAATDELRCEYTDGGDGTVPLRLARVPGLTTYYVEESHGQLANNRDVARAVADVLDHGSTDRLPKEPPPVRRAAPEVIAESKLRALDPFAEVMPAPARARAGRRAGGVRSLLRPDDLRGVLAGYAAPGSRAPTSRIAAAPGGDRELSTAPTRWNRLLVGRARQHRLDIQIVHGSITQVSARAYVLGLFREVTPSGAAAAIDRRLDGAISEFMRRRMFAGGVGEVFMMPANRSRLPTDMVVFAGMGWFDQFNDEVQQTTAENVIRTFVRTRVEDFATVLFGSGSGADVGPTLTNLMKGFVRGKLDADVDHHFRCVTICETDRARYESIRAALYELASTPLFDELEVTFTELQTPPPEEAPIDAAPVRAVAGRGQDPVYLIVRREREADGQIVFGSALLTAGAKAAILTATRTVADKDLEALLQVAGQPGFGEAQVARLGRFLLDKVLADSIRQVLPQTLHVAPGQDRHLVVVHDAPTSRLPWETLRIDDLAPARVGGISRRYMASHLSVARYLEQRRPGATLRLLLVVNPTLDLPGAEQEGARVAELFGRRNDVTVIRLDGARATRKAVLRELTAGRCDLVHYAGHAHFDPQLPERSGLRCADREVLTGVDLATIGNLPQLVFFNACESGRVRGGPRVASKQKANAKTAKSAAEKRAERVAPAEAFLSGGVANFIGTYWEVGDASAMTFSEVFYRELLAGKPIGTAILTARQAVHAAKSVDWADYIHYGDHGFTLR